MLSCVFCYVLHHFSVLRVRIAERLKAVAFIYGVGNSTSHFHSFFLKEAFSLFYGLFRNDEQVSVSFQINLVHFYLAGDDVPCRIQPVQVFHLLYLVSTRVDRNLETLVVSCLKALHT